MHRPLVLSRGLYRLSDKPGHRRRGLRRPTRRREATLGAERALTLASREASVPVEETLHAVTYGV